MTRLILALLFASPVSLTAADETADYLRDVKPILKARCFSCHGALKQESGLRLDTAALIRKGGDSGAGLLPGQPAESRIVQRITESDDSLRMPPEGKPLTPEQIGFIRQWIQDGAATPPDERPEPDPRRHWSFKKPVRPAVPKVASSLTIRNPIDAFIASRQAQRGVVPLHEARRDILLRRVYLDLIGLPPTRAELHEFLADESSEAYERVVDRLLKSPHYGERWGRHWMDVWRYSDWYGRRNVNDVRNSYPHIWRWRDWIIDSLNDDKGYDQMVREMLAADELYPADDSRAPALGFIVRNWFSLNYDTWKQDLVEHTGKAFLGLRLNCAHCHDHKYDPITQEEYFRFRAFFEPLELRHDRVPGGPALTKYIRYTPSSGGSLKPIVAGLPRVYDHFVDDKTFMYRLGDTRDRFDRPPVAPGAPAIIGGATLSIDSVELPSVAWYPGLREFVRKTEISQREEAVTAAVESVAKTSAAIAPIQKELDKAKADLDVARKKSTNRTPIAERSDDDLIAFWRFEGENDETGFLADSSGNGHTLHAVTGSDPAASPTPLSADGLRKAFRIPDLKGSKANAQAARFQQQQSYGYLAASGNAQFQADEFSFECFVHFDEAQRNFNRTIADYDGAWTLLHRGINATTFELRLRYSNSQGQVRDVATGKIENPESPSQDASQSTPLILNVGHDYYLCLVFGANTITLWAADLTNQTPLQWFEVDRSTADADFSSIARPGTETPFKIGNSDGTGRVNGLIDEVRLTRAPLSTAQIAAAIGQFGNDTMRQIAAAVAKLSQQFESARSAHTAAQSQLNAAQADLRAVMARLTADKARYEDMAENADELARSAAMEERSAKLAAARAKLATAESVLARQTAARQPDAKKRKQADQEISATRKSIAALEKLTADAGTNYTAFSPQYPKTSTGRRSALANWIAGRDNALTARVAVNHIWLRHFGRPLVESVFDFGRSGTKPTHPELLDWLAVELMTSADSWRMKHLHRLIVTSSTYRLSSRPGSEHSNLAIDKDNSSWWKFERRRLEAETVRDAMLHVSGQLDATIGGQDLDPKLESESPRRSLYFSVYPEGGGMMRFMTMFDAPDPCDCYRRTESIVPQQALVMSNSTLALNCGRRLAGWLSQQTPSDNAESTSESFIVGAFEQILSRPPTSDERLTCLKFLARQHKTFLDSKDQLKSSRTKETVGAAVDPVQRARESLIRVLLNHNDFVTLH